MLWSRLQHRDLGYYLAYLGSFAFFMTLARAQDQVVGLALSTPYAETLIAGSLAASAFFFVCFAREFLQFATVAPRFDRVAGGFLWLNAGLALGALSVLRSASPVWIHVVLAAGIVTHLTLIGGAIFVWRSGATHARYFVLSFGALLLGALPLATQWLLAIPFGNAFLGTLLGSALEMLLLSLAVADRFARLQRERYEAKLAEETARLEALRYQLNPHFLFNTLNSLSSLVMTGRGQAAEKMIQALSSFYRRSLAEDPTGDVALDQEVALQRAYLEIESARFPDRLVTSFEIPQELETASVPGMILQPLVENAVKYAVAPTRKPVTVTIAARQEDGCLVIAVTDNGPGARKDPKPGFGIGLANVRDRLEARYGAEASLTAGPAETGGWHAVIRLPLERHDG